jgi:hypothetical protein
MFDLRFITAVDTLPIKSVDIESMFPLVVRVTGEHFDYASQVLVNHMTVTPAPQDFDDTSDAYNEILGSFQILAADTIRLVCPKALWDKPIERINVLGDNVVYLDEMTKLTFEFQNFRPVRGITRVMQNLCKLLKTTPGTDFFNPDEGGGLHEFVGMTLDQTNIQGFTSKLHLAIKRCVTAIKNSQRDIAWKLPADEVLLDAIPIDITFDPEALAVSIILDVQTAARQAVVKMGV